MQNRMANSRWGTLDEMRAVPSLGIHVMTEFEYCPRAGLVAYESNREDTGEESSVENLDYLPLYDLREINRELNLRCPVVYRWLAVGWDDRRPDRDPVASGPMVFHFLRCYRLGRRHCSPDRSARRPS